MNCFIKKKKKKAKLATGARLSTVYFHAARMLTYALMMTLKGDIFAHFRSHPRCVKEEAEVSKI